MAHTYKIKCIIKRPDEEYGHMTAISDTLENLQRTVEGYIECVTLVHQTLGVDGECVLPGLAIICNEEGIPRGLPYNCRLAGIPIFGDFVILGFKGDEFCDCPVSARFINSYIEEIGEAQP